ncbi:MAG: hypothetical protein ACFFA0_06575, partial [Promethearchaeota archaeon]
MDKEKEKLTRLFSNLKMVRDQFIECLNDKNLPVIIYTHLDADGLSSGAILGKALYRKNIPFQITVLRQLEKREIAQISKKVQDYNNFLIFSDFGSGQYLELQQKLIQKENFNSFLILDHHIPQNVSNVEDFSLIKEIHEKTKHWHVNPYFFGVDGSCEISSAGLCY